MVFSLFTRSSFADSFFFFFSIVQDRRQSTLRRRSWNVRLPARAHDCSVLAEGSFVSLVLLLFARRRLSPAHFFLVFFALLRTLESTSLSSRSFELSTSTTNGSRSTIISSDTSRVSTTFISLVRIFSSSSSSSNSSLPPSVSLLCRSRTIRRIGRLRREARSASRGNFDLGERA